MKRKWNKNYISKNGHSPETNRLVGSGAYAFVFLSIFFISFKIWGLDVFDDIWFWIFNVAAYWSVGWFLRKIGFWVY